VQCRGTKTLMFRHSEKVADAIQRRIFHDHDYQPQVESQYTRMDYLASIAAPTMVTSS
jgi:hypothetical protein